MHKLKKKIQTEIVAGDVGQKCTLAAIDSKSMPMVILEGNAWGLIIRSGRIPVTAEKGISISGHSWEQTPFCPCLLLNLSPITGFLGRRRRIFTCPKHQVSMRET